jgi:hypothetical protein
VLSRRIGRESGVTAYLCAVEQPGVCCAADVRAGVGDGVALRALSYASSVRDYDGLGATRTQKVGRDWRTTE